MKTGGDLVMGIRRQSLAAWISDQKIVGFFLIGMVSSLVDIGLLVWLCASPGVWYLSAAAVSYCCGIVCSYVLNKYLNFHNNDRHVLVQFTTFAAISFACLLASLFVIWVCVEVFFLNYLTGKILATLCAFFWNYSGQKRFTFREGS